MCLAEGARPLRTIDSGKTTGYIDRRGATSRELELLEKAIRGPGATLAKTLTKAVEEEDLEMIGVILKRGTGLSQRDKNEIFLHGCRLGKLKSIQLFLPDPLLNPGVLYNSPIQWAAENGHLEIVRLLMNDPRVNPGDDDNRALAVAARSGHLDIVELLLTDSRVDATDENCKALRFAVRERNLAVVIRLLAVPEVANQLNVLQDLFGTTNVPRIIDTVKEVSWAESYPQDSKRWWNSLV